MRVQILFFGATAVSTGKRELDLSIDDFSRAEQAFSVILEKFPSLKQHRLLFSINQEYSKGDEILSDGDELAIFTAVSGG